MQTDHEPSAGKPRPALLAGRLLLWLALPLAWLYLHGLIAHAPKWEEPRRCMVAAEMIHRGDYVVPRVMGEIYRNKPPLYDWSIALAAGLDADAVSAGHARAVSIVALAAMALLLSLAGSGERGRADGLPALLLLVFALVIQNGRAGETDVLFCLLLTAAVVCFDVGRRRGSPWIQWTLSQLLVGLGAMTKGLSPLFFYPPVLWLALRRPSVWKPRALPMLAGAAAMAGVMALWLVPYSRSAPVADLQSRWVDEVLKLYVRPGWSGALRHLLTYPLMVLLVAAPWSLLVAALPGRERRATVAAAARDPWVRLCWTVAAWVALVYLFVPGVRGRYLMPLLPFLSVCLAAVIRALETGPAAPNRLLAALASNKASWLIAALGVVAVAVGGRGLLETHPGALAGALAAIAFSTVATRLPATHGAPGSPVLPFLLLGLVYGAVFVGVTETRRHVRHLRLAEAGRTLAASIDEATPVVCDCHDASGRKVGFALMQALDRPFDGRDFPGPHFRVTHEDQPPERPARAVETIAGFTLWQVAPGDGEARLTLPDASEMMPASP